MDPNYFRPTEVDLLLGDSTKAREKLGWKPKWDLNGLIEDMMEADLKLFSCDKYLVKGGFPIKEYHE